MYDKKLNLLFAYPYLDENNVKLLSSYPRDKFRLVVDSGAFSVFNSGKIIKFEEYTGFLDSINHLKCDAAVQLDVVFNPSKTHMNYQKHLDRGDNVCPVFTRGDKWSYFENLLEQDKYIFVGGVQGGSGATEFAKYILERTQTKKIHYLAFVRPNWLNHYKPYSVDCSSWSTSARFGSLQLYVGNGRIKTLSRSNFLKRPNTELLKSFEALGFDINMVKLLTKEISWRSARPWIDINPLHDTDNISNLNTLISLCSYIKYSVEAQNKIGTKIYLAGNFSHYTLLMFYCYDWMLEKGIL